MNAYTNKWIWMDRWRLCSSVVVVVVVVLVLV